MAVASGRRAEAATRTGLAVLLVLCSVVSGVWLALGAVVAATQYWPPVTRVVEAAAAAGSPWAAAVTAAAPASEPMGQAVLDYGFSVLNLVIAVVLLAAPTRTWAIRLLALALVGAAGAFNLQAHAAARAIEVGTGLALGGLHQVVLHALACAAYILALLVFPTPTWDGLPGGKPARRGLAITGILTLLFVGLGTALLPHTTSCVLFFGFLVPVVGLVVLPRRVRRGPGAEQRTQARLLFSTLVGGVVVAVVLGIVTLILSVLGSGPGLMLVDPTAHVPGSSLGEPLALLFWFSRLVSAAVAVVVLVATQRNRLWTAERWFSRGLAVLLVMAVCGGGFVVLRTIGNSVIGPVGAVVVATVAASLTLGLLYVQAERLVDRLLYGSRPTPYSVLADIMSLSHSTTSRAPDLARVAEAVALGLGASTCRLTVRRPGLRDRTYEWTDRTGGVGAADLLEVPIHHGNEQVGALTVDRQAVSGLNAQRDSLLADIADGLGVVLEASRTGIELERQLRAALAHAEEIAVSRRQAVEEMDSERRRIERDLHDGAQHHLVSLRLTLGLVEHQVAGGELGQAREWLHKLTAQLTTAEAVLAATADGVSSHVLSEKGLVAALEAEFGAVHPPVGFDAGGIAAGRRFPARIEAAVWFCCAESVGNARKHAPGAPVTVRLTAQADDLTFVIQDEGPGFALVGNGVEGGRGLHNMTGRISAVGGTVTIRSTPGAGTTVEGSVPLPQEADSASTPAQDHPPAVPERSQDTPAPDTPPDRPGTLIGQMTELLRLACAVYRGTATNGRVDELAHRLVEPVRIAVVASTETGRRILVEALIGAPDVPRPPSPDSALPVWFTYGGVGVDQRPDAVTVTLPAPALRAVTLVDAPTLDDESLDPAASDRCRTLLGAPGDDAAAVDGLVLLLRYGRRADARLLEVLHAAGHRRAIGVLARADDAEGVAERAAGEYDSDAAVRRVCQAVVSVRPETAVAAARLGDEEHRLLHRWAAAAGIDESGSGPDDVPADVALVVDELGPSGARRALDLVRRGEANTRGELSAALVRDSGLADLQELISSRFVRRADVLRCRSVLAGLDAVLRAAPPAGDDGQRLHYQLERVRAGAHELREIELLDALRSGDLFLPDEERRAAELLLGADGEDARTRLGLGPDAPLEQMRAEAAEQPARWRNLAAHPMTSTNLRSAAQVLIRTCEQLAVDVDDMAVAFERNLHGSDV
jgi:signal transduction histidine kinase